MTLFRGTIRRALRVPCSPLGLATVAYSAAALLFGQTLPIMPSLIVPCPDNTLIGFSQDGQSLVTRNVTPIFCGTGLTQEMIERMWRGQRVSTIDLRDAKEFQTIDDGTRDELRAVRWDLDPDSYWVFWNRLNDPSYIRRMLETVHGPESLKSQPSEWPRLPALVVSPDGRFWAHRNETRLTTARWFVHEFGSGRQIFETSDDVSGLVFGPTADSITSCHYSGTPGGFQVQVKRRHIASEAIESVVAAAPFSSSTAKLHDSGRLLTAYTSGSQRLWFRVAARNDADGHAESLAIEPVEDRLDALELKTGHDALFVASSADRRLILGLRPHAAEAFWVWVADNLGFTTLGLHKQSISLVLQDAVTQSELSVLPQLKPRFSDSTEEREWPPLGSGSRGEDRVMFATDNGRLAVIGDDGYLRVWNLPARRPWLLILALPLIPAAPFLLFAAWRRFRAPKSLAVGV